MIVSTNCWKEPSCILKNDRNKMPSAVVIAILSPSRSVIIRNFGQHEISTVYLDTARFEKLKNACPKTSMSIWSLQLCKSTRLHRKSWKGWKHLSEVLEGYITSLTELCTQLHSRDKDSMMFIRK
jgi:hypothetical protein